jgi:type VI secretion system protein ImpK
MEKLNAVVKDCLNAINQLKVLDEGTTVSPRALRARMKEFIEQMKNDARGAGYGSAEVDDMAYALVAFADEVAVRKSDAIRSQWLSSTLQLELFNENTAGEGFFRRLDAVRADPRRLDVLRVFYLCLLFGFEGKYSARGEEAELIRLTESVRQQIERGLEFPETLSPNGERPDEPRLRRGVNLLHLWVTLGLLVASAGAFIGLRVALGSHVDGVVKDATGAVAD